jgi:zinc protease
LERGLGALPAGARFEAPLQPLDPGAAARLVLDKQQAVLAVGFPACGASGEERFALHLLREFCADMSGPIFTRIREELGLAYTVGATQFLGFETGLFTFYLGTAPEQVDFAHRELSLEVARIAGESLTHDALERTRTALLSSLALQNQSNSAMARACALDIILGLGAEHHLTIAERIKAVSLAEVRDVATRLFGQAPTTVVVGPGG